MNYYLAPLRLFFSVSFPYSHFLLFSLSGSFLTLYTSLSSIIFSLFSHQRIKPQDKDNELCCFCVTKMSLHLQHIPVLKTNKDKSNFWLFKHINFRVVTNPGLVLRHSVFCLNYHTYLNIFVGKSKNVKTLNIWPVKYSHENVHHVWYFNSKTFFALIFTLKTLGFLYILTGIGSSDFYVVLHQSSYWSWSQ